VFQQEFNSALWDKDSLTAHVAYSGTGKQNGTVIAVRRSSVHAVVDPVRERKNPQSAHDQRPASVHPMSRDPVRRHQVHERRRRFNGADKILRLADRRRGNG